MNGRIPLDPVYIVGVAETPLGMVTEHTELSMMALAAREALAEAGIARREVDGLFVQYRTGEPLHQPAAEFAEYLGLAPRYVESTDIGGGSFEAYVHHAMLAVAAGRCEVALVAYASRQRSRRTRSLAGAGDDYTLTSQFEAPHGLLTPVGHYALIAARHMYEFGTRPEHLAEVAVAARQWAARNPKAWLRDPLTADEVLGSLMVSDPLHKLDCCLVTDGGGALVITNGARASDAAARPVRVLGAGECATHWHITGMTDLTAGPGAASAREAFAMAGVSVGDIDFVEPYDNFTSMVIMHLEDLGFCARGEGGPMIEDGCLRPGGSLPAMTSGGGLSYCHPGMLGLLLLVEAVRQLRGEAGDRQVADASIGVVHGIGGISFGTAATVVLGRD